MDTMETGERVDNVFGSVVKMVEYVRERHKEDIEMELRIGQFTNNGEFFPGYQHQNKAVISRLLKRLEKNSKDINTWENVKQYVFIRAEYPNGIRQTCIPKQENSKTFSIKKRLGKVDISTDRIYDLRFSLCRETPVQISKDHAIHEMVKKNKPESVRVMQRASFTEEIPMGDYKFKLQYDISKVSKQSQTKLSCTKYPCTYHCEIELLGKLLPLSDKDEENRQNEFIARSFISRGKALLGTFTLTPSGLVELPQPKLYLLNNDI